MISDCTTCLFGPQHGIDCEECAADCEDSNAKARGLAPWALVRLARALHSVSADAPSAVGGVTARVAPLPGGDSQSQGDARPPLTLSGLTSESCPLPFNRWLVPSSVCRDATRDLRSVRMAPAHRCQPSTVRPESVGRAQSLDKAIAISLPATRPDDRHISRARNSFDARVDNAGASRGGQASLNRPTQKSERQRLVRRADARSRLIPDAFHGKPSCSGRAANLGQRRSQADSQTRLLGLTEMVEANTVRSDVHRRPLKHIYARSSCARNSDGPGGGTRRVHSPPVSEVSPWPA